MRTPCYGIDGLSHWISMSNTALMIVTGDLVATDKALAWGL